jgi:hypothetical protein
MDDPTLEVVSSFLHLTGTIAWIVVTVALLFLIPLMFLYKELSTYLPSPYLP